MKNIEKQIEISADNTETVDASWNRKRSGAELDHFLGNLEKRLGAAALKASVAELA